MIDAPPPPEDRRPPLTPQLAVRVALVGTVALALFAIIFFRLWFLQVLSGPQYVQAATANRVRDILVPAARGEILDRNGTVMVDSIPGLAVQIVPADLPVPVALSELAGLEHPPRADAVVYNRLARVLGMPTKRIRCQLHMPAPNVYRLSPVACKVGQALTLTPYADVTVRQGSAVSKYVQYYIGERQDSFPGVQVVNASVTAYPLGGLAAQVLGTVGPITTAQVKAKVYPGVPNSSIVGQSGLEYQYNSFLQGKDGEQKVQINAFNQPSGALPGTSPTPGENLRTSLDVPLQRAGQLSLAESMSLNDSPGGAFVALDPDNGQVYAMGSLPTFNPSIFTGDNLSQSEYDQLISPSAGEPLLNRAIASAGPTGSTFKVITATAALQSGVWTPLQEYDDTGTFSIDGETLHNSGHAAYGSVDLIDAIRVSDDIFFYNLGAQLNANPVVHPQGGALQQWARAFGIGQSTGIDLPDSVDGTLPSPAWRAGRNRLEQECDDATGPFKGKPKHPPGGCGIADLDPWTIGDNINLAVGQGDVQVTPLQLAVVYSAIANGGTIVRPHIGLDVESRDGTVLQRIDPPPSRHIAIDPGNLAAIQQGLREAASQAGGTSADVMGDFPQQVYGKTGTAEYNGQPDYAWYACFVPASATSKPIVVVVTVEQGGFGDVAAAPVARQILSQWFYGKMGPYKAGISTTL